MGYIDDHHLSQYINEIFALFDTDRSGKLNPQELHLFFNELFARLGDPRRYNSAEIMIVYREADMNHDGEVDRNELLRVCKLIFQKQPYQGTVTVYHPPPANYVYHYYTTRPRLSPIIIDYLIDSFNLYL